MNFLDIKNMSPITTEAQVLERWKNTPLKDKIGMILIYYIVAYSVYIKYWKKR